MDEDFLEYVATLLPRYFGEMPAPQLRALARRLEPQRVASGELLYRHGEAGDCMHFVVTGRLQVHRRDKRGEMRVLSHLSGGDCVGELALLTGQPRAADVLVTRDSMLARLDRATYAAIVREHPEAALHIARFALRYLSAGAPELVPRFTNLALVPLHAHVPIREVGRRLELALLRFGTTQYLDSIVAWRRRDQLAGNAVAGAESASWFVERLLDQAEKSRRFVICEADHGVTEWTRTCVAHADCVLFVADPAASPAITPIEQALFDSTSRSQLFEKELVLLKATRRTPPSGTAGWIEARPGYRHSHVAREGGRDFNRLARRLSGNSVNLVLGGGGARGFAQIGAVRALREAGVPIDAVGGTSMGAIVGALVALGWDDERLLQSCKRAFVDDRPLDDVTLPLFSLLRGKKLARTLQHHVGDVDIEDLWQPYFCVSSNLSRSAVHVHHSGSLWRALLASVSLPGLLPPVVVDGDLYVDGGVLDNLPVGVMKQFIGGNTIAVDPTVRFEYAVDTESFPAPLQYVRSRLAREGAARELPMLANLLIKCTVLGGRGGRGQLQDDTDLYLNPPMRDYGFLDWDAIYEIVDVGYRYTQERLPAWIEGNPALQRRDELLETRSG